MQLRTSHTFLLALGASAAGLVACFLRSPGTPAAPGAAEAAAAFSLRPEESSVVEVFERSAGAVVFIRNNAVRRDFFSLDVFEVPQGTGSGFFWDRAGHVVTNFHVVQDADSITVTLEDQSVFTAAVVGVAPDKDLAVLRIQAPAERVKTIEPGRNEDLRVGMTALAIGNPFGLDRSLSMGIVSALGREIRSVTGRTITDVIQTDAAVNPGNSGGPLLNSAGQLIGVTTAIASRSGQNSGVGFAIPVSTVKRVVTQILKYGRVIQPGLGITYFQDDVARRWGVRQGVVVRRVFPDTAAAAAGIEGTEINYRSGEVLLGDIIVKINEHEVRGTEDLLNTLDRFQVGDVVQVTFVRGRSERKVDVKLQAVR
jgi:S1-C subfamily serine protease